MGNKTLSNLKHISCAFVALSPFLSDCVTKANADTQSLNNRAVLQRWDLIGYRSQLASSFSLVGL